MWLADASQYLGWPKPDQVQSPVGGGASHYARQVEQKIGAVLKRRCSLGSIETGILTADPAADSAEAPLAVVILFDRTVGDDVLREAHRLCWNFSRTAILVTLEPARIQAWTCALAPKKKSPLSHFRVLNPLELVDGETQAHKLQTEAAQVLHWVNLVSGEFLRQHQSKFRNEERADTLLVSNLRSVRKLLIDADLDRDICHALLARLIFTQFLFQRTDSDGRPAINQTTLDARCNGTLKNVYQHADALPHILGTKEETYSLFYWLNEKFNGDLFPGEGQSEEERESEWKAEKNKVTLNHLKILAEFVSGKINLENGQQSLWPEYSFDTLPLEFISSVYEEFLNEDQLQLSAYYTPPHLVDFVLDGVLPWGGKEWDIKILDPCCGSAIFLVKAFQRLIQRWKNAHPNEEPRVDDLRGLLTNNLLGVDASAEAIRVASFSLCLALCDAIDPKHYWKQTLFPRLRNTRLIQSDFFNENQELFKTGRAGEDRAWDLVVGNAPWRGGALTNDSAAILWAQAHDWPVADKNPGPLFLFKAAAITKPSGFVAMIQPAATLLYQRSWDASDELRRKLFTSHTVEEVVSFAQLRFQLFKNASSPACLITLRPTPPPDDHVVDYICPKPLWHSPNLRTDGTISIEAQDIHRLQNNEAANDPLALNILILGQRRDLELIRNLQQHSTLKKLKADSKQGAGQSQVLLTREGIIRGKSNQREEPQIVNRKILETPKFPEPDSSILDGSALPTNRNPKIHEADSSDFSAFILPQLIIKKSILKDIGRFQSQLVKMTNGDGRGILCTHSYISVHQFNESDDWLHSACLTFRSRLAAYFLALTSRLSFDRGEALSNDILHVPIPSPNQKLRVGAIPNEHIDDSVEQAFGLRAPERAQISDLIEFTYREGGRRGNERPGREVTLRDTPIANGDLQHYAEFFLNAVRSTFGNERAVRATIFEESQGNSRLPIRMVAIHLDWPQRRAAILKQSMSSSDLRHELGKLYKTHMGVRTRQGSPIASGLGFQRVARLFITHQPEPELKIPTIFYLKPDQRRYWTRSLALRDADELASTIIATKKGKRSGR